MFWHIETDIVSLLVMGVLYYYTVRLLPDDSYTARNRGFVWCLRVGLIAGGIDVAASVCMDVPVSRFLYQLFMTGYLLSQNFMIVAWFMYALTILCDGAARARRLLSRAAWALYAVFGLLALTNPWSELFFSLGPGFEYARGPLFMPGFVGLYYLYAASLLALALLRRGRVPRGYPWPVLVMQPVILGVAIPIQLMHPGWLMIVAAYMLCLVLAFMFFQNVRVRGEREQLRQLTEMVEHFACGLAICSVTDERGLDVQYISGGLAAICELDAGELHDRLRADILTGVHPRDRGMVAAKLQDMRERREEQKITYRFVTDAGAIKWVNIHARVVEQRGGAATVYATYTDLTELKKAEGIIDVALENTGVSIWEYDFRRRCIIQYQNSTEMHGFEQIVPDVPESLVESGFVHPESREAFLDMYDQLRAGAPFAEGVFKVQTPDRRGYWYEHIRYTNAFDENGRPYRAVGMSTDETERQEAIELYERELEKERGFMADEGLLAHATFDLNTGAVLDYRYQDGSPVLERDRSTFADAAGKAELLIDEAERERFLALNDADALLERFAAGETEFRQEYRRRLPGGMVTWVRNTLRLLKDPHSGHVLLFEYWFDIEAEKMLELMYRSIATDNYDFVARIDGRTRRFDCLTREGLTSHMPPRSGEDADAVTRSLYDGSVAAEDRAAAIENSLIENVRRHLRRYGRFVFTYRMTRPDGALRYKKVTQYFIDAQREIIAVLREDVTELIQAEGEKNRALSEALDAANRASLAKSQFLSRVSHELRTPLNAIIGFMELARDADEAQTETYLANSDAAARQLLSIINDVLDVASIESGKLRIASAEFDMDGLLASLESLYVAQCRQKGLAFRVVRLTPVDAWLRGDRLRVNQILLNLLNNALKFTAEGGVELRVSQRALTGERVLLRFQVADTGCGMSGEMQSRLFQPFEQESAVTAQKYGGSGLGLSIVRSIVSLMDGAVGVESSPGRGSTFTVDIPFLKTPGQTPPEPPQAPGETPGRDLRDMRILLAEDNPMNRMVAENLILRRFGAHCDCAVDGQQALELFLASPEGGYDAILMDIQMPNVDGYEATRRIRASAHPDAAAVQIIAVTANAFSEDVTKSLASGMDDHVSKPIEPQILGAALARALEKRRGYGR